jgi:hypothetical protein
MNRRCWPAVIGWCVVFTAGCSATSAPTAHSPAAAGPASASQAVSSSTPASTGPSTAATSATNATHLMPADSRLPASGVCGHSVSVTVVIDVNPDTPAPRCIEVTKDNDLEVVNRSDRFGQHGASVIVRWAGYPPRALAVGAKTTYSVPFGQYLATGVHFLHLSVYGDSSAEIWLR